MPSLYHFSAVDAASAVDYSRDVDDGVVNSPPPKRLALAYVPSPSPLSREKRTLVRLGRASTSTNDGVARRGPSRRLSMDPPPLEPAPTGSLPAPLGLSEVVAPPTSIGASLPSIPDDSVRLPVASGIDDPKPKVTFSPPIFRARRCSPLSCIRLSCTSRASVLNRPPFNPSLFLLPRGLVFRRSPPDLLVADPPRRLLWIGTPSRPRLLIAIGPWSPAEAQGVPSRTHTRIILITKSLRRIREPFRMYGTTAHIPGLSTNMDSAAGRRYLEPWKPLKPRRRPRKTRTLPLKATSGTYNRLLRA